MQPFIDQQVERTNRNLLMTVLFVLVLLAGVGALFGRYYLEFINGPFTVTLEQVARGGTSPEHTYVRIEGRLVHSGYQHVTYPVTHTPAEEENKRTDADYLIVQQGGRTVLIKAPVGTQGSEIVGFLHRPEWPESEVLGYVGVKYPRSSILPVVLDASPPIPALVGLAVALGILVVCAYYLWLWASRRARPELHPIHKRLAQFGEPRSLAAQINSEIGDPGVVHLMGVNVTHSWILRRSLYGLAMGSIGHLAWIHKRVTNRQKPIIGTDYTMYEAVLNGRDGKNLSIRGCEADVDQLLRELVQRAPWVLVGFTKDLETAWISRRAEVIAAVDSRRRF